MRHYFIPWMLLLSFFSTSVLGSSPTPLPDLERERVGREPGTEVGLEFA